MEDQEVATILKLDEKCNEYMDKIYDYLQRLKIPRGNRSMECMGNQPAKPPELQITPESVAHLKHPTQYIFRNMVMPQTIPVGIRWNYYINKYVSTAHDKMYGKYFFNLIKDFCNHLGKINNLDIDCNTATLNKDFVCSKHKDRMNKGKSVLFGFGDYEDGETIIYNDNDKPYKFDINRKPILFDGSKYYHEVLPFKNGNRYSVVSYLV